MSEIVKCFHGNYNGIKKGLVIAKSKKQAAKIVGTTLYDFNQYWSNGGFPDWKPDLYTLYTKSYSDFKGEWEKHANSQDDE